jgi:two-component system sensor histidine kinase YesM
MRIARKGLSLKWGLLVIMALCWIVPVAVILLYSSYSIDNNVQSRIRETITTSVDIAFAQTEEKLKGAMNASRASSYDDTIRNAYERYQNDNDGITLNDSVTVYLRQQYGYDSSFYATFLFFTSDPHHIYYANNRTDSGEGFSFQNIKGYRMGIHEKVLDLYPDLGTGIGFFMEGQKLYMVRNIVDKKFNPYAVIVMKCNQEALFESIRSIVWLKEATVCIDDITCRVVGEGGIETGDKDSVWYDSVNDNYTIQSSARLSGHTLRLAVISDSAGLLSELPDVRSTLPLLGLFAAPLLLFVVWAYYSYVSHPVDVLVDAAGRMEAGERGYTVTNMPASREFRYLTERFNSMSQQLQYQFERIYQEQIELQDARMKALRSQINPHFLNNTLEVILWEARMAKNEKVCRMIEALSTMLDAATARGGRARGTIEQELIYTNAYLHILAQRLGDRLTIRREIAPETLKALVPCLILQPIVENAIEHGIALRQKGELVLRIMLDSGSLILEVENDGNMTQEDKNRIERLLDINADTESAGENVQCVGIHNVMRRLKILYGEDGGLSITEVSPGRILARIVIPYVEFDAQ